MPATVASTTVTRTNRSPSLDSTHSSVIQNMSEDDYGSPEPLQGGSEVAPNSSGRHHTPGHRKGPRFSWTPQFETTFFRSLCDSVNRGLKDNHSFKSEAWDRACQALAERHQAYPNKGHLINKSDNARKKFRLWRGLREDPEFLYNPKSRTVTASEEAWRVHIEVSIKASLFLLVVIVMLSKPAKSGIRPGAHDLATIRPRFHPHS